MPADVSFQLPESCFLFVESIAFTKPFYFIEDVEDVVKAK